MRNKNIFAACSIFLLAALLSASCSTAATTTMTTTSVPTSSIAPLVSVDVPGLHRSTTTSTTATTYNPAIQIVSIALVGIPQDGLTKKIQFTIKNTSGNPVTWVALKYKTASNSVQGVGFGAWRTDPLMPGCTAQCAYYIDAQYCPDASGVMDCVIEEEQAVYVNTTVMATFTDSTPLNNVELSQVVSRTVTYIDFTQTVQVILQVPPTGSVSADSAPASAVCPIGITTTRTIYQSPDGKSTGVFISVKNTGGYPVSYISITLYANQTQYGAQFYDISSHFYLQPGAATESTGFRLNSVDYTSSGVYLAYIFGTYPNGQTFSVASRRCACHLITPAYPHPRRR